VLKKLLLDFLVVLLNFKCITYIESLGTFLENELKCVELNFSPAKKNDNLIEKKRENFLEPLKDDLVVFLAVFLFYLGVPNEKIVLPFVRLVDDFLQFFVSDIKNEKKLFVKYIYPFFVIS